MTRDFGETVDEVLLANGWSAGNAPGGARRAEMHADNIPRSNPTTHNFEHCGITQIKNDRMMLHIKGDRCIPSGSPRPGDKAVAREELKTDSTLVAGPSNFFLEERLEGGPDIGSRPRISSRGRMIV